MEVLEGRFYLLEAMEVPEAMYRVLLCMLEAVEGELYAPRTKEPSKIADVWKWFRYFKVASTGLWAVFEFCPFTAYRMPQ